MTKEDIQVIEQLANQVKMQVFHYNRFKAGEISWDKMCLKMIKTIINHSYQDVFMFIEWLEENENNTLPEQSSGSFYTALTDIDNFISLLEIHNFRTWFLEDYYNEIKAIFERIVFNK